jgi:hypothetical protein
MSARVKEGSILLHPTKGVNPRLCFCPHCMRDGDIIMLGAREYGGRCPSCNMLHIGIRNEPETKCTSCGHQGLQIMPIPDEARIPVICDECRAGLQKAKELLDAGGCEWRCEDCNRSGIIEHTHPIAEALRKSHPPGQRGVILTKAECPFCTEGAPN